MMVSIIRFDLGRYLHSVSTWIYFGILGGLAYFFMAASTSSWHQIGQVAVGPFSGRPFDGADFCDEHLDRLAVLIDGYVANFHDGLVRFGS